MNEFNQYYKSLLNEEEDIDLKAMFPPATAEELAKRTTLVELIASDFDLNIVKYKVEVLHTDVNEIDDDDPQKTSPLLIACSRERFDIAKYLIEKGADVNYRNKYGYIPLSILINKIGADLNLIKLIIDSGANLNTYSGISVGYNNYMPLLTLAIEKTNTNSNALKIVSYMLDHGANPNFYYKAEYRNAPLIKACLIENTDVIELLIKHNVDINKVYTTQRGERISALSYSSLLSSIEIVNILLRNGADYNFILDNEEIKNSMFEPVLQKLELYKRLNDK